MYYYQHHIGDFIRDTSRLSDAQSMAYLRLLWIYYDTEKPITNDHEKLAFQIGATPSDVRQILDHYFEIDANGMRTHDRCEKEITHYHSKSEKAKIGAKARWENANAMRTHTERNAEAKKSDANQEPITNNQSNTKPTSTKSAISISTFLQNCDDAGEKRIPENDAVFDFAEKAGIPLEMIKVCWKHFVETNKETGKRQKDWRRAFRNCVKGNWYKLWFVEADGTVKETSQYRALKKGLENVQ